MSWKAIEPAARAQYSRRPDAAVSVTTSKGDGRLSPRVTFNLRLPLLTRLPWLHADAEVLVELGEGDHAGQMRISDGGPHRLFNLSRCKPAGSLVSLRLPVWGAMDVRARAPAAVPHEIAGLCLILRLPAWANPPRQPTSPERGRELAAAAAAEARRRAGA